MSSRRNDDGSRNNGTSNSDDPPMSRKNPKLFHLLLRLLLIRGFTFVILPLLYATKPKLSTEIMLHFSKIGVPPFLCVCVFSGLFIICNKQNTEEDFREAFQKFGKIEEIYTIKDRNTGDSKGKRAFCSFVFTSC